MRRAKHPQKKTVLLVTDFPIQNEVDNDLAWSGASHLSLLSDLAKVGISQRDIHTTYLSYERQEKDSYDWSTEIKKKKNLPQGCNYGQESKEVISEDISEATRVEEISYEDNCGNLQTTYTGYKLEALPVDQDWFSVPHQKDLYISRELSSQVKGLLEEITKVKPKMILVVGKWSYFFLVGNVAVSQTMNSGSSQKPMGGLAKHRASLEELHPSWGLEPTLVFPLLPPITKQRSPDKIPVMKWDYAKVGDIYDELTKGSKDVNYYLTQNKELILGTDFTLVCDWFKELLAQLVEAPVLVSVDIETRWSASIDCIGFAYEKDSGICVPFSTLGSASFWSEDEELEIYRLMSRVLTHPNCRNTLQNGSYDAAFIYKFWLIELPIAFDTMIAHHVLYNSMQKDLAFLASVYCENFKYWKDLQTHSG